MLDYWLGTMDHFVAGVARLQFRLNQFRKPLNSGESSYNHLSGSDPAQ
jgi:hypothetical protein